MRMRKSVQNERRVNKKKKKEKEMNVNKYEGAETKRQLEKMC